MNKMLCNEDPSLVSLSTWYQNLELDSDFQLIDVIKETLGKHADKHRDTRESVVICAYLTNPEYVLFSIKNRVK